MLCNGSQDIVSDEFSSNYGREYVKIEKYSSERKLVW